MRRRKSILLCNYYFFLSGHTPSPPSSSAVDVVVPNHLPSMVSVVSVFDTIHIVVTIDHKVFIVLIIRGYVSPVDNCMANFIFKLLW